MKTLGIDLGTSDTYVYETLVGTQTTTPVPIYGNSKGCVATSLLYDTEGHVLAVGQEAESEFHINGNTSLILRTQFKPEIALAESGATLWMVDFLRALKAEIEKKTTTGDRLFYVGVPSRVRSNFELNLLRCFQQAGWPSPTFVKESNAALASCIHKEPLDSGDIRGKILILDFGAGTLDYTLLDNGETQQVGGDSMYGGRLFDDLFYQIFLKKSQEFNKINKDSKDDYFLHWVSSKEQKESFSDQVLESKQAISLRFECFIEKFREFFIEYSVEEFENDVRNYVISGKFKDILSHYDNHGGLSPDARDLIEGKNINLIDWLEHILENVEDRHKIKNVIVTGGSGKWYFVKRSVENIMYNAKCTVSSQPYADVASGLALYNSLEESFPKVKEILAKEKHSVVGILKDSIDTITGQRIREICDVFSENMREKIRILLIEYGDASDLTVHALADKIAHIIKNDNDNCVIVTQLSRELLTEINRLVTTNVESWLIGNGISLPPSIDFADTIEHSNIAAKLQESMDTVAGNTTEIIRTILPALIAAAACLGGAGVALLDPTFITAGTVTIAGIGAGLGTWLAQKSELGRKYVALPKTALTNDEVRDLFLRLVRKQIRDNLSDVIAKNYIGPIKNELHGKLETSLQDLLRTLTVLNQLNKTETAENMPA